MECEHGWLLAHFDCGSMMRDKKCRLILFVGEKHSGKTALLQRFAERLKKENFKIAGFIAPSIYRGVFYWVSTFLIYKAAGG